MQEGKILTKLAEIDQKIDQLVRRDELTERLDQFVTRSDFDEFKDFVATSFDEQLLILKRLDEEHIFTVHRLDRLEEKVNTRR